MSAMSASPVKPPVLPQEKPPVATTPPKVGMMPIPATLSIAQTKPTNMNHNAMPLSLIADHKMAPQFTPQPQNFPLPVPAMQPLPQSLPRTLDKPKELATPTGVPQKPTSNGVEGLVTPNQAPFTVAPTAPDSQASAVAAPPPKQDPPLPAEMPEGRPKLPENAVEPSTPAVPAAAEPGSTPACRGTPGPGCEASSNVRCEDTAVGWVENADDKKNEKQEGVKPAESGSEAAKASVTSPPDAAPTPVSEPSQPNATPSTAPTMTATTTATAPPPVSSQPPPSNSLPPQEQAVPPTVTPSVSRTEPVPHSKPELKVATIPRQATKRKRETKVAPPTPEVKQEGKDDDRKSKRVRLPTQPYQSPLPELNIIAKMSKSSKSTPTKAPDDKLIVFYKNEFLAVRNAEGGFYVCQAMQNIYKSSPRIRIRWLSQEEGKDTYSPDFYDTTDFDCILTNLNLDKVEKEKYRLPQVEQQRTESILKRALDVEKGVSEKPPVTEEHPDGLDLSLFRDESQLKKSSKNRSRNSSTGKKSDSTKSEGGDSLSEEDENEGDADEEGLEEDAKDESPSKTSTKKKKSSKKKQHSEKKLAKSANSDNKNAIQPSKKTTESRVGSKRKSSVSSTSSQPNEKRARKSENSSQSSERTNKTRSVEVTEVAKSRRDLRAKSRK